VGRAWVLEVAMEIVKYAYDRWQNLPYEEVLDEMAILFHLAVQIEQVRILANYLPPRRDEDGTKRISQESKTEIR